MAGAALLAAAQVVRNAAVAEYAETRPQVAARLWSSHPSSELWLGLTQIGFAAGRRQPVAASTLSLIRDAAQKSPLSPEPFLVRGVQAQLAHDPRLAAQAFLAAKLRDGRSVPARYFLAEHYFRNGDAPHGLREISILARMIPDGVSKLAPFVAAYAKDARNRPQLLALFRSDPQLEEAALATLASDPANADLTLALARPSAAAPAWTPRLLDGLVGAGQYAKARAIWAKLAHVTLVPDQLIFDPALVGSPAPPPFNWTLNSSTVGLAERKAGGRLHAIFYGQEDGVLASQLLVLTPGRYRLSMRVTGDVEHAGSLGWTVTCAGSSAILASLPLNDARHALQGMTFEVTADCPAQHLELAGHAPELPQQVDVTVSGLSLTREGGNG